MEKTEEIIRKKMVLVENKIVVTEQEVKETRKNRQEYLGGYSNRPLTRDKALEFLRKRKIVDYSNLN